MYACLYCCYTHECSSRMWDGDENITCKLVWVHGVNIICFWRTGMHGTGRSLQLSMWWKRWPYWNVAARFFIFQQPDSKWWQHQHAYPHFVGSLDIVEQLVTLKSYPVAILVLHVAGNNEYPIQSYNLGRLQTFVKNWPVYIMSKPIKF